jgi:peptide/nickel transport system permease protein
MSATADTPGTFGLDPVVIEPAATGWPELRRRILHDRAAVVGGCMVLAIVLLALAAPLIAAITGHGRDETFVKTMLDQFGLPRGPTAGFPLGADKVAHDELVRIAYGAQTALIVGLGSTGLSLAIGVSIGALAGYARGWLDAVLSRVIELFLVMPVLVLALGLASACGGPQGCGGGLIRPGLGLTCFVIGATTWPYVARVVRSQVLSIRESEFVAAARLLGRGTPHIVAREILPNLLPTVIVIGLIQVPGNILYEASLAFLGVGIQDRPSWGAMLAEGGDLFPSAWWLLLFPAFLLSFTILGLSLFGEGVKDALDLDDA